MANRQWAPKHPVNFHLNKCNGRWSAWVRRPSIGNDRHYIGCFSTFHMAVRSQDRMLLKINAQATLNFRSSSDYQDDAQLRDTLTEDEFMIMLKDEARPEYTVVSKSPCYVKFERMEEDFPELRRVVKRTFRDFVASWTTPPPPSHELTDAATVLRQMRNSPKGGLSRSTLTPGSPTPSREEMDVTTVLLEMHNGLNCGPVTIALAPGRAPPSPELTRLDAAAVLCELRMSLNGGLLATPPTSGSTRNVPLNVLGLIIPKGNRSPKTPRFQVGDASSSSDVAQSRIQTRMSCKRRLKMQLTPSTSCRRRA